MSREGHRDDAYDCLRYDDIPRALVHALLALSADPEPTLAPAAQPDLPPLMHEVHAAITPERMRKARVYLGRFRDDNLRAQRNWRLQDAAIALARVIAADERLAAIRDD